MAEPSQSRGYIIATIFLSLRGQQYVAFAQALYS